MASPGVSNIIGLIVPGHAVQVHGQVMSENEILFSVPAAEHEIGHVVLFLTGAQPLPPDHGASAYLMLEGSGFKFLGALSNAKPSAIFKLGKGGSSSSASSSSTSPPQNPADLAGAIVPVSAAAADCISHTRIGILVEPLSAIEQKIVPKEQQVAAQVADYLAFVKALAQNCYDHMSGWILTEEQWRTRGAALVQEKLVPITALEQWFDTFRRKLAANPNFWKKHVE
eukprot:g11030.t1